MAEGRGILLSPTKIKSEPESESDYEVNCRLCDKVFASCMALQNHARMFHTDAYETGDSSIWTKSEQTFSSPELPKLKVKAQVKAETDIKTKEIIAAMKPTNINSLASKNISYIIIKTDILPKSKKRVSKKSVVTEKNEQRKRKREIKKEKEETAKVKKTEGRKSPEAITGPFECLEASTFGADGTCHQMFFSCCEYSEHQLSDHARPRRRVARCQVCERPLSQLHQNGPKEFPCEFCSEGFDANDFLELHKKKVHNREKKFPCTVCQKSFFSQGGLSQHMRCHTGDRPYACTFCTKSFTQKSGLEQHIRTHTKVKPFRCVVCNKTFIQTVHLKQHMRTHTNVTPFQCGVCDRRFKQKSHLNYHLKHHLKETMTPEQQEKYKEIMGKIENKGEERKSVDLETFLAEQSIQEEGSDEVQETYAYVDEEGGERIITCEVHPYDS